MRGGAARALILAAGRGTRLGGLTVDGPKAMVELQGRTLLAHQRAALAGAGIDEVHMVIGHGADRVRAHPDAHGLTLWNNAAYASTNMVASLMCASALAADGVDLIITYGDIVFESRVVEALLSEAGPLAVAVDLGWRSYWEARMEDPLTDAETLRLSEDGRIVELGARPSGYDEIDGQYLGLLRIDANMQGHVFERAAALVRDDPQAYMTELIQALIDEGTPVRAATVRHGWLEIDTSKDLSIDTAPFWRVPHGP